MQYGVRHRVMEPSAGASYGWRPFSSSSSV